MKFDLTKFPLSDDDTQLKDEKGKLSNYRDVFLKGLAADIDEMGNPIRGEDKFKRFDMYMKFKTANGRIDLSAEEVVMLTKVVLVFPTIVAGQSRDFLAKPEPEIGAG